MVVWQVIKGASSSMMVACVAHVEKFPAKSVAVTVTSYVPGGKLVMASGTCVSTGNGSTSSVTSHKAMMSGMYPQSLSV